jgi:hypothetical protein
LVTVQAEWADNAVSNTLYFRPKWVLKKLCTHTGELLDSASFDHDHYIEAMAKIESGEEDFEINNHRIKLLYDDDTDELIQASLYIFDPNHEEDYIEPVLSSIIRMTKSVSLLPHTPQGVYAQMPEEGISEQEFNSRRSAIKPIDWSRLRQSHGQDEKYCQGDACNLPVTR